MSFVLPSVLKPVEPATAIPTATGSTGDGSARSESAHVRQMMPDSVVHSEPPAPNLHSAVLHFGAGGVAAASRVSDADQHPTAAGATSSIDGNPIPIGIAYRAEIFAAAKAHHIDPMLLAAQAAQESGGPGASSGRNILQPGGGGHGVFQIDPVGGYGPWLAAHHNGLNVRENADKAASIDEQNLKTYGSTEAMLTVYNAGHNSDGDTAITDWPDGKQRHYAASVEQHLVQLQQLAAEQQR